MQGNNEFRRIAKVGGTTQSYIDFQVELNKTYSYKVRAWKYGYQSEFSNIVSATTKLNPPSNLSATTSYPYTSVSLTWQDNSNYETGFEIWRKDININWRKVATLPANSTSYIDYNVSRFNDYFYKVRAK